MLGRMPGRTILVVVGLAAAVAAYVWWTSPERQIRRVLADVAEALSHDRAETGLGDIAAVRLLQQHLAVDVSVSVGTATIMNGRQDVVATAARIRATTPMLRVRFTDETINVDGDTATADFTARITSRNQAGEEVVDDRVVNATFRKDQGRWVVASARVMQLAEQSW